MLDVVHRLADLVLGLRLAFEDRTGEDQVSRRGRVPVGIAHIGVGQHALTTLPVERMDFDHTILRLGTVGPRIHAQGAADRAGNSVIKLETADAAFKCECSQMLVGTHRPR